MKTKLSEEELLKLSPEELYKEMEHLAEATVYKLFNNPSGYAKSIHMELEDLFQFAKMGLFKGIQTFHTTTHNRTLRSFLIQNIRWSVHYNIWRSTVQDRVYKSKDATDDNVVNMVSMSYQPPDSESTLYDVVSNDNINSFDNIEDYPENKVISKFDIDGIMNVLNDNEKELVKLRIGNSDLTYREIAEIYGVTKQCIGMKFKKIQSKIRAYLDKEAVAI